MRRSILRRVAVLGLVAAMAAPVAWAGGSVGWARWEVGGGWASLWVWVAQLWAKDGEGLDPTACPADCTDAGPERDPFG